MDDKPKDGMVRVKWPIFTARAMLARSWES